MSTQTLFLGLIIATLSGALFHLVRGGRIRHLFLFLIVAWISFFIGHFFSESIAWHLLRVGALNLFPALLATILGLVLTAIFIAPESRASRR